jgi:hypothetical protein
MADKRFESAGEHSTVTKCGSPEELLKRGGYFARVASGQIALA